MGLPDEAAIAPARDRTFVWAKLQKEPSGDAHGGDKRGNWHWDQLRVLVFTVHKLNEACFPVTVDYGSAVPFRISKAAESVNA